ncbi:DUF445 family protein [Rubrivirga sp. S365]|uniref:DUF445 family protein n=1 Tax=Rubrivirga litoralis TaxID=3075598 RepID=A0ABU3BVE3_9BACT|nr:MULTISPECIES: DUF445 family protein [unclassified Rubrivirga]MDT0633266.1 DUF445 family protein [Rubrivirga sp. F394]MDT7855089.1 DUF445 family protein [Rubrivirga sp. S365]
MSDSWPQGPRRFVPVPGVIDLDDLEPDDLDAAARADAEPDAEPDTFGAPPRATAPTAPPPAAPAEPPRAEPLQAAPPPAEPVQEAADEPPPAEPEPPPDEDLDAVPNEPLVPPPAVPDPFSPAPPIAPDPAQPDLSPGLEGGAEPRRAEPEPAPPAGAGRGGRLAPPRDVVDSAKEATRSRGREFVQLVLRYGRAHVPQPEAAPPRPDAGPPRMVGRVGQLIPVLRVVPWLLAVVFAASFLWDVEGSLLRVLSVSGLIGFATNWLAITMLFQPREKRAIVPQGLIPAQRERVIYRLSEAISRELINADIIKQKIQESGVIGRYRDLALGVVRGTVEDPGFRADLKGLATDYASEVLGSEPVRREVARLALQRVETAGRGLGGVALGLYRTFAEDDFQRRLDRALDELPGAVTPLLDRIDTALDAVPAKVEARADEIEEIATRAVLSFVEGFDVRTMIQERARGFDESQLEDLLKSTSNEQLNYIKYLGAVLGVLGGLVIWRPAEALAGFAVVGLALWALDEALVRARRRRA